MTDSDKLSDRAAGWAKRTAEPDDSSEPGDGSEPGDSSEPSDGSEDSEPDDGSEPSDRSVRSEPSERSDPSDKSASEEQSDTSEPSDQSESDDSVRQPANVKEAWDGNYYYIPPDISAELDEELARLQYECRDVDIKKNRHFNVVMVVDGLESIREMSGDEFKARLAELRLIAD